MLVSLIIPARYFHAGEHDFFSSVLSWDWLEIKTILLYGIIPTFLARTKDLQRRISPA
jgi:hypothetical protein